jgi:arylsulfatase A-like enzyme
MLLRLLLASFFLGSSLAAPPNVVLLLVDDQGYGELSAHGNAIVRTPALDQLRRESTAFTQFHVAPMCTPTRAQLMTGMDAARTHAVNVSSGRSLLNASLPTLPQLLQKGGYATGLFGKWHLGENYPYRPQDRGFQEVVTFPSSHIGSVPDTWENDYFDDTYLHNGNAENYQGYTTDVFFSEAMSWMKKQAGKPFFLYLPTAAPHSPYYVPQSYRDALKPRLEKADLKLPAEVQQNLLSYLAMIENLDQNLARMEAFLKAEQLLENTLFIYLTDNGTTLGDQYFPCGMRGKKVTLWEGGHRVPCFIRWPAGKVKAGAELPGLAQAQDIFSTVLDATSQSLPETDGISLLPVLRSESALPEDRALFINYSRMPVGDQTATLKKEGSAVLWKDWRWLEDRELYDVSKDPLQTHNLAGEKPEIVKHMRQLLDSWWQGLPADKEVPQRITIGHAEENPSLLTACDWWHVFVDQQGQVRRGERKNGTWHLQVAEQGTYHFELRRWPRAADAALSAELPATKVADGWLSKGQALPISAASIQIGQLAEKQELGAEAKAATFRIALPAGPIELRTAFHDASGAELLGAYYVYVTRL